MEKWSNGELEGQPVGFPDCWIFGLMDWGSAVKCCTVPLLHRYMRSSEIGEFLRCVEPEFKGAIQRATACKADAGNSALDCGVETLPAVGRGSGFKGEKRGTQTVGED